ncbi:MAG: hypothetical protein E6R03_12605 [Hyphomicrobiaceae bacterium]|nr:MAG: hypothetical protein E6R03_12605 [Hyphomicrobiaceae bacterium]
MDNGDQGDDWGTGRKRRTPWFSADHEQGLSSGFADNTIADRCFLIGPINSAWLSVTTYHSEEDRLWFEEKSMEPGGFGWACELLGIVPRMPTNMIREEVFE